jgi:hypothetical protein
MDRILCGLPSNIGFVFNLHLYGEKREIARSVSGRLVEALNDLKSDLFGELRSEMYSELINFIFAAKGT